MNLYSKRRKELLNSLKDNSAIMLFSGKAPMCSADEAYPFVVDRNFYYFTGLEQEEMTLLMYKIDGRHMESLFILPFDETLARWVGGRILPEKATEISGIRNVQECEDLDSTVGSLMNVTRMYDNFTLYFDLWHYNMDQGDTMADVYVKKLKEKYPAAVIKDAYAYLTEMRLCKDEYEVECTRKAIAITNDGVKAMMKASRPEMSEMMMEATFDYELMKHGCREHAFQSICASGERATILHYSDNSNIMKDNELFLCDLGARYSHYCADISRTFPVNGKFSERQKEIYNMVLTAQKIVEENARPGITLRELNQLVVDYYEEELPKHGLNEGVSEYYFHSVSHQIGLDTHDVSLGRNETLKPGNIISNEPGLYIADEGIGIRIEDDLLITEAGCEVLSKDIIKTVEDIENFMKK